MYVRGEKEYPCVLPLVGLRGHPQATRKARLTATRHAPRYSLRLQGTENERNAIPGKTHQPIKDLYRE